MSSARRAAPTSRQTKLSDAFARRTPGQQAGLGEDLEAVADAEHEPARVGERADRAHDGRGSCDGAAAEVVAEREPAGRTTAAVPSGSSSSACQTRGAERRDASGRAVRPGRRSSPGRRRPRLPAEASGSSGSVTARPARSRSSRSAGWSAVARTSARAARGPRRRRRSRPRRRSGGRRASRRPRSRGRAARSDACPWDRGCPASGRTSTVALIRGRPPDRRGRRRSRSPSGS